MDELRRLAYADLDEAVRLGASLSIQEMIQRGREIHHDTQEAFEYYEKGNEA